MGLEKTAVDSRHSVHMLEATLEIGAESFEVYFSMFDEREGAIYAIDGERVVRAADDSAVLRPIDGSPIPITIVRRNLTTGLTWSVASLTFSLRAEPPPASEG